MKQLPSPETNMVLSNAHRRFGRTTLPQDETFEDPLAGGVRTTFAGWGPSI